MGQAHDSHDLVITQPLGGTDDETTGIPIGMAEDGDGRLHPQITLSLDRISTTPRDATQGIRGEDQGDAYR